MECPEPKDDAFYKTVNNFKKKTNNAAVFQCGQLQPLIHKSDLISFAASSAFLYLKKENWMNFPGLLYNTG